MPVKKYVNRLFVYMNGMKIGTLIRQIRGNLEFTYNLGWLQREGARPISLSMPLTEVPYRGEEVYNFFDNLLPDSTLIRKRIQARFQIPTNRSFDLLAHIGVDCVGALQLLTEPIKSNVQKIKYQSINIQEISRLLKNYRTAPLGMDKNIDFRLSIAGAQEKTALLWRDNQWNLPVGPTPTSHILKLPIGRIMYSGIDLNDSTENEWLCLQILSKFGLPTNHAKIVYFEGVKTLVIERFDRRWSQNKKWLMRLPQEDMCQTLGKPSALKYESDGGPGILDIMNVLRGAYTAREDRKEFMKRVFLFWMLGAIDGHAKNFSIFIEPYGNYRLTPIYDVISAYPIVKKRQLEWQDLKMAMSLKSKNRHYFWHTIQLRHWFSMSKLCRFPEQDMHNIIEEIYDKLEKVIDEVSNMLSNDFPTYIAESIFSGMKKIKNKHKV